MKQFLSLIFLFLSFSILSGGADAAVTSVTLSGPTTINCPPGSASYSVVVNGTYSTGTQNYFWAVYDADVIFDDKLKDIEPFQIEPGSGNWSETFNFNLSCNSSGYVVGPYGSSGENTAEVYVNISNMLGTVMNSNTVNVTCNCVPEPQDYALIGVGGLFLFGLRRHQCKIQEPETAV